MAATTKQGQITTMDTHSRNTDLMTIVAELGPKFAARAAKHDAEGTFVAENFQEMRDSKLFSAAIPTELGGGGATHMRMMFWLVVWIP